MHLCFAFAFLHEAYRPSLACLLHPIETPHSALALWIVQATGTLPRPAADLICRPFMNQIAVLPLLSRQRMSLLPSPLKSPVSAIDHAVGAAPMPPDNAICAAFINHIATLPLVSR